MVKEDESAGRFNEAPALLLGARTVRGVDHAPSGAKARIKIGDLSQR